MNRNRAEKSYWQRYTYPSCFGANERCMLRYVVRDAEKEPDGEAARGSGADKEYGMTDEKTAERIVCKAIRFYKPVECPRCGCTVVVRKQKGVKASLLKKLALADHMTTHAQPKFGRHS